MPVSAGLVPSRLSVNLNEGLISPPASLQPAPQRFVLAEAGLSFGPHFYRPGGIRTNHFAVQPQPCDPPSLHLIKSTSPVR
ncbi:unnamed protein product [Protopolystoma xenopodis]|uniref:Uncharacterized protein n=1 Tax=Protopolystoma xenopodis TaxID=117903 RepID=A0A448WSF7_9PLAT|nr:unnamed protein product [Protopolystoma xenopodis]